MLSGIKIFNFFVSDHLKEARALLKTLLTFADKIYNGRVKAAVDSTNLINFFKMVAEDLLLCQRRLRICFS